MSWINSLRTSNEELGTLAENEPPTEMKWRKKCRKLFQGCFVKRADKSRKKGSGKKEEATQGTVDLREVWQMAVLLADNSAQQQKKPKAEVNRRGAHR